MSLVPAMRVLENQIPPPVVAALFGFVMWLLADAVADFSERGIAGIILVAALVLCGSVFCIAGLIAVAGHHSARLRAGSQRAPFSQTPLLNAPARTIACSPIPVPCVQWTKYSSKGSRSTP